jgi:hypothetical protein
MISQSLHSLLDYFHGKAFWLSIGSHHFIRRVIFVTKDDDGIMIEPFTIVAFGHESESTGGNYQYDQ